MKLIEITLIAQTCGTIPPTHGHLLHGMLFGQLRRVDEAFAAALHAGDGAKPFSLSPLRPVGAQDYRVLQVCRQGMACFFQVGVWDDALAERVLRAFSQGDGAVMVGDVALRVASALVRTEVTLSSLAQGAAVAERFAVRFDTLTCFRSSGHTALFPEVRWLFGSLARTYQQAFGVGVDAEVLGEIAARVWPVAYALQTHVHNMQRFMITGFVGRCQYAIDRQLAGEGRDVVRRLLAILPVVGVGYKTTMGMGRGSVG